jgi:DNA-binding MarR family transcriptional regulator
MSEQNEIAHEVLRSIRRIVRRISEHSRSLSRDSGLTVPQLMCLKAIGELEESESEITVAMVSDAVHLSPATISRIVDRLTNGGLVLRERRAQDRRKVCLSLTPAGIERFQTLPAPLQERFVERLSALDENERLALLQALKRISALMDAEDLDAAPLLVPGDDVKLESE